MAAVRKSKTKYCSNSVLIVLPSGKVIVSIFSAQKTPFVLFFSYKNFVS